MNISTPAWAILFLAVGIAAYFAAVSISRARLKRRYPPMGKMIDIGGFHLHMYVEGQGNPTVVMDSGAGGFSLLWDLVRPALAKATRVVVYDRAGLGWSEPSPQPRTADIMAEELHQLLLSANIEGPYILVGHSLGGAIARQFAARYSNETAGLVMVDSAHELQATRFPEQIVKMFNSMMGMVSIMKIIGKSGIMSLNPKMLPATNLDGLPENSIQRAKGVIAASKSHFETMIVETMNVLKAETKPVPSLGNLPMIVISHGGLDENAVPASFGPEVREDYEKVWQELQVEIAALSTLGRRIIAENSGHNVQLNQPQIVIDSVLELINITTIKEKTAEKEVALAR